MRALPSDLFVNHTDLNIGQVPGSSWLIINPFLTTKSLALTQTTTVGSIHHEHAYKTLANRVITGRHPTHSHLAVSCTYRPVLICCGNDLALGDGMGGCRSVQTY